MNFTIIDEVNFSELYEKCKHLSLGFKLAVILNLYIRSLICEFPDLN